MRSTLVVLSVFGLASAVSANRTARERSDHQARLPIVKRADPPSCAADCYANMPLNAPSCSPSDTQCFCTSSGAFSYLRSCFSASCPVRQHDSLCARQLTLDFASRRCPAILHRHMPVWWLLRGSDHRFTVCGQQHRYIPCFHLVPTRLFADDLCDRVCRDCHRCSDR